MSNHPKWLQASEILNQIEQKRTAEINKLIEDLNVWIGSDEAKLVAEILRKSKSFGSPIESSIHLFRHLGLLVSYTESGRFSNIDSMKELANRYYEYSEKTDLIERIRKETDRIVDRTIQKANPTPPPPVIEVIHEPKWWQFWK